MTKDTPDRVIAWDEVIFIDPEMSMYPHTQAGFERTGSDLRYESITRTTTGKKLHELGEYMIPNKLYKFLTYDTAKKYFEGLKAKDKMRGLCGE